LDISWKNDIHRIAGGLSTPKRRLKPGKILVHRQKEPAEKRKIIGGQIARELISGKDKGRCYQNEKRRTN